MPGTVASTTVKTKTSNKKLFFVQLCTIQLKLCMNCVQTQPTIKPDSDDEFKVTYRLCNLCMERNFIVQLK
uniref:Uncharacterized protein n=1 Tax=Acrobeloides nanus TaxID=290746 RepID=A0A914EE26_9BILA